MTNDFFDIDSVLSEEERAVRDSVRRFVDDRVIVTNGDHTGRLGGTNTLKLLRVGAEGVAEGLSDL